jgi:excisionase family DNA binding protein
MKLKSDEWFIKHREPTAMTTRDLLTAKEVAKYLRVNQYTIYRLVSQKKLPAFKWDHNGALSAVCWIAGSKNN